MSDRAFKICMIVWVIFIAVILTYDLYVWIRIAELQGYVEALRWASTQK